MSFQPPQAPDPWQQPTQVQPQPGQPGGGPGWSAPPSPMGEPPQSGGSGVRWLVILGVIALVLALAAVVKGATSVDVGDVTDLVEDPVSQLDLRVDSPGTDTVQLSEGRYWVFASGQGLGASSGSGEFSDRAPDFQLPDLRVKGPDGAVDVTRPDTNITIDGTSSDLVLIYEFRARSDGRYALRSSGGSSRVDELALGSTDELWESAKALLGPVAWVVAGVILGFLGAGLLVIGMILAITRRSGRSGPKQWTPQ